jgi:hypothetical protein
MSKDSAVRPLLPAKYAEESASAAELHFDGRFWVLHGRQTVCQGVFALSVHGGAAGRARRAGKFLLVRVRATS